MNRINLDPKIWGPYGWFFLVSCILSYPDNPSDNDKQKFSNFIDSIKYVLPCEKCRIHFSNFISDNPLNDNILSSKNNLLKWVYNAQNNVKKINNETLYNYNEYIKYYEQFYDMESKCNIKCLPPDTVIIKTSENNSKQKHNIIYQIIIITLIFVMLYYYKKYQSKITF